MCSKGNGELSATSTVKWQPLTIEASKFIDLLAFAVKYFSKDADSDQYQCQITCTCISTLKLEGRVTLRRRKDLPNGIDVQGVPSGRRMGWIDLDFYFSTVCADLPRLVGIWQKSSLAAGQNGGTLQS